MNYKERLKELRTQNNLTQKELADILKISRSTYKDYELQIKIIPIEHLINVADYFHISIDYLLDLTKIEIYQNTKKYDKELSASRLKEFRKENQLTQEKLANILNTTHSMISNYENCKDIISTPFLYTICKKYNVSADYLLGKIDNPKYLK